MKFADAFASQVKTVTLHAYNLNGDLVFKKTEKVSDIAAAGGYMTLDINPCIYTLQVWAEGEERQTNSYIYNTDGDINNDVTKSTVRYTVQTETLSTTLHTLPRTAKECRPAYGGLWCKDCGCATYKEYK